MMMIIMLTTISKVRRIVSNIAITSGLYLEIFIVMLYGVENLILTKYM